MKIPTKCGIPANISTANGKTLCHCFDLSAVITCAPSACCHCGKDCYARRMEVYRKSVRNAHADNTALALDHLPDLEAALDYYFMVTAPRFFRLHASGDFVTAEYLDMWLRIIRRNPETHFLAFTKQFDVIRPHLDTIPGNLSLIVSAWPGMDMPQDVAGALPVAWIDGDPRRPEDAHHCTGNCGECGRVCWMIDHKTDVYFDLH